MIFPANLWTSTEKKQKTGEEKYKT